MAEDIGAAEEHWPTSKIASSTSSKAAILVTTGAMNPIHRGHVRFDPTTLG